MVHRIIADADTARQIAEQILDIPIVQHLIPASSLLMLLYAHAILGVLWAMPMRPCRSSRIMPPCPLRRALRWVMASLLAASRWTPGAHTIGGPLCQHQLHDGFAPSGAGGRGALVIGIAATANQRRVTHASRRFVQGSSGRGSGGNVPVHVEGNCAHSVIRELRPRKGHVRLAGGCFGLSILQPLDFALDHQFFIAAQLHAMFLRKDFCAFRRRNKRADSYRAPGARPEWDCVCALRIRRRRRAMWRRPS